jgi:hypothetical protein
MFTRRWHGTSISLVLIAIFLTSTFSFLAIVNSVQAAPTYQLVWKEDVGIETHIGALAAKLVPGGNDSDIVLDGVSQIDQGFSNGSVLCLDGATGNVLWNVTPGNIQDHSPFEISDIDNDGQPKIIVADMPNTLVLDGNNGSIDWKNTAAPSYDLTPVTADVDGSGYQEIFVASGNGPYQGYDYITELSHNGTIIAQNPTSWHPCYGGLTMAYDNGTWILLMGDRGEYGYNPASDPYKYGGWGVRALNATTLTPLWNDSSVLCSSMIPMLYDVDGNGGLEVVVGDQLAGGTNHTGSGLAVYNLLTGQIDNSSGIYRYSPELGLQEHSQPTIYTDPNGMPELITCENSDPQVWNLRDWTLTATINLECDEPPKMGQVTADGQQDIIAVSGNTIHILNENFQEVGNISLPVNTNPNQFTLVAPVDGSGYNDLVITTRSGWVYCYRTPALATNPAPRSNVEFYSENRDGVAQYVNPPGPSTPIITAVSPANGSTNVSTSISSLSFKLLDYWGNPLNYTVTTTPNIGLGSGTNVYNGVYNASVGSLSPSTTYTWTVTATDGIYSNSTSFQFTTAGPPPPPGLTISSPTPVNGLTGVSVNISSLSFNLADEQSNQINYTVTTTPNIGSIAQTNVTVGPYALSVGGLNYLTTYTWTVNATDSVNNTVTSTFSFTTSPQSPMAGWQYRMNVTISHTQVASNLTNFPVLIDLTSANLAQHAQPNGNDIVFTDSSGNKLNDEIESYNSTSGQLTAWVMIPNLSSTTDTVLSMYYGNPTSPNQQNPAGVWNSNYLMVQHMNSATTTLLDSTSNNNDGTATGSVTLGVPGQIGTCVNFTGGYITLPTVLTSQTQFTFSAWIYPQSGARYIISEWYNYQGAFLQISGDSVIQMYINGLYVQKTLSLNQWHYVVGTFNGTTANLYVDGVSATPGSPSPPTWPLQNNNMFIGNRYDYARGFVGLIDEVRVSNIATSSAWISTEYANQNNPATFYTISLQETLSP